MFTKVISSDLQLMLFFFFTQYLIAYINIIGNNVIPLLTQMNMHHQYYSILNVEAELDCKHLGFIENRTASLDYKRKNCFCVSSYLFWPLRAVKFGLLWSPSGEDIWTGCVCVFFVCFLGRHIWIESVKPPWRCNYRNVKWKICPKRLH